MAKVYFISCRDAGADCNFQAQGSSLEEVIQLITGGSTFDTWRAHQINGWRAVKFACYPPATSTASAG